MPVECEFVTGAAGSGKSFELRRRVDEDPKYGIISATTGVAALNTGSITINSLIKFFDANSLRDIYVSQRLHRRLKEVSQLARRILIDEVSMLSANSLDILFHAISEINEQSTFKNKMALVVSGDFAQLPPIKEPWAFQAECWREFDKNTTRLEKNWRQTNDSFLSGLNCIRRGDGGGGLAALVDCGIKLEGASLIGYPGTTILSRNQDVDRFNFASYQLLDRKHSEIVVRSRRWGEQRTEWNPTKGLIPLESKFRVGAYVMILANDAPKFTYVNGDCGYVRDFNPATNEFLIELVRNKEVVRIGQIDRHFTTLEDPDLPVGFRPVHLYCECEASKSGSQQLDLSGTGVKRGVSAPWGIPSWNCSQGTWNVGAVRYHPLRLAYAATVHKTQGLTLDRVQVDFRNFFFSQPAMMYVALSRCRTPEGLRLVGSGEQFMKRVRVAEEVKRWL
jgi:ATP-dependent DNA helicase PIF1